ncbi:MAG: sulfotransferase [Thermoplasmata archaeon]|nr:MAG: sulfotransferase [Thermoplasmata archaeon]
MKNIGNFDQQHLQELENIEFQPIFILGLHRSGTSILYKMLTATQCFNPLTAYHIIKYDQLLHNYINNKEKDVKNKLTNFFKEQGQVDRGIDRLQLTANFAEEYGFLLKQKTFHTYLTSKNLLLFTEMAKKVQYISNNDKPLLLKNPYDFSNFLYIKQMFPNAKFIFIHRHPLNSLNSTIKAIRFLLKHKNPYTAQLSRFYNNIFENPLLLYPIRFLFTAGSPFSMILLTMLSAKATKYYLKNIKKLQKNDYISIKYEDLCKNPQETVENIMRVLDIKIRNDIDFKTFIKPRKTKLDVSVIKLQNFIFKRMKTYFESFGYTLEKQ